MKASLFLIVAVLMLWAPQSVHAQINHCYPDGCVEVGFVRGNGQAQAYINKFLTFQDFATSLVSAWVDRSGGFSKTDSTGRLLGMACYNGSYFNVLRCTNDSTNYPTCDNKQCTNGASNFPACNNVPVQTTTGTVCSPQNICSGNSLVNSCTGAVVEACTTGCSNNKCDSGCQAVDICNAKNNLYHRNASCIETLVEKCSWQCVAGRESKFCSNNDVYQRNSPCSNTFLKTCVYPQSAGCSRGECLPPPNPELQSFTGTASNAPFAASGHLQVRPTLVQRNSVTQMYWNAINVSSCTVTSTNGDIWNSIFSGVNGQASRPLPHKTTYTLSCNGLPGATSARILEDVIVNVVPIFEER